MLLMNQPRQHRTIARDLLVCSVLIAVGIASRELLESWPNFKPLGAICIWAGLLVSRLWIAVLVPPVMMVISDVGMGSAGFGLAIAVQVALVANLFLFRWMRPRLGSDASAGRVQCREWNTVLLGGGLIGAGSIQFFLTTNFAVWATTPWYAPDLAGLSGCYVAAVPFFWNTLLGDCLFGWTPLVALQMSTVVAASRKPANPLLVAN